MPYVVDYHPAKRRRIATKLKMARRKSVDEQQAQNSSTDVSTGSNIPTYINPERSRKSEAGEIRTSNREELIECIKRGENPTWVPSANLQALYDEETSFGDHDDHQHGSIAQPKANNLAVDDLFLGPWTKAEDGSKKSRSAFHSGDFNGSEELSPGFDREDIGIPSTVSPISMPGASLPWLSTTDLSPIGQAFSASRPIHNMPNRSISRKRAPSLGSSLSSSFVLRTPTSPLVHAVNNTGFESSTSDDRSIDNYSPEKTTRRRTMPPNSYHMLSTLPTEAALVNYSRPLSNFSRELSIRNVSHQPRRSLSSFTYHPSSSPQSPHIRSRRQSFTSDLSPRRRTSMVGSFEESILRGRMSSPASQPFDFIAEIGVMGKGNCPANLKCPAHVSVPFQAVYYHYPASLPGHSISDEAPSPYVGTIDLEHNLKPVYLSTKYKREPALKDATSGHKDDPRAPENTSIGRALARDAEKQKQRSASPKITVGGAYRVPQKGQIQIIVKNQHKTAVKLFLVPYDLEGMESGTKTFVRQRSYSRGPILEGALDSTAGIAGLHDPLKDKHILRYLVHLRFCCPAKGKYYLNDHIRMVFANRVPDGKEKLENELQLPDPKFSPYRPLLKQPKSSQQSYGELSNTSSRLSLAKGMFQEPPSFPLPSPFDPSQADLTIVSEPENLVHPPLNLASTNVIHEPPPKHLEMSKEVVAENTFSFHQNGNLTSATIPLETSRALSPVQGFLPSTSTRASPIPWGSSSTSSTTRSFSPVPVEAGNGLLSQQFRDFYKTKSSTELSDHSTNDMPTNVSLEMLEHVTKDSAKPIKSPISSSIEEHSELGDISLAITHGVNFD